MEAGVPMTKAELKDLDDDISIVRDLHKKAKNKKVKQAYEKLWTILVIARQRHRVAEELRM